MIKSNVYRDKNGKVMFCGEWGDTDVAPPKEWSVELEDCHEINGELIPATEHEKLRRYPSIEEQLDFIYHHGFDAWKSQMISPIKERFPKL